MALPKSGNEVPQVSTEAATDYVQKMVKLERARTGNVETAIASLSRKYKIGVWPLTHLFKGRAKTCDTSLYSRVRAAYLDHCAAQIRALQHELELEQAAEPDAETANLAAQAAELAAKIAAQRAQIHS